VPEQSAEVLENEMTVVEDGDASTQGGLKVYMRKQNEEIRPTVTLAPTSSLSQPTPTHETSSSDSEYPVI
jgi:hypothetical protein